MALHINLCLDRHITYSLTTHPTIVITNVLISLPVRSLSPIASFFKRHPFFCSMLPNQSSPYMFQINLVILLLSLGPSLKLRPLHPRHVPTHIFSLSCIHINHPIILHLPLIISTSSSLNTLPFHFMVSKTQHGISILVSYINIHTTTESPCLSHVHALCSSNWTISMKVEMMFLLITRHRLLY